MPSVDAIDKGISERHEPNFLIDRSYDIFVLAIGHFTTCDT